MKKQTEKKRYYRWVKYDKSSFPPSVESTKDFIPDGNEYINEQNGWSKNLKEYIEVVVEVDE